jgi:hypothetical protein
LAVLVFKIAFDVTILVLGLVRAGVQDIRRYYNCGPTFLFRMEFVSSMDRRLFYATTVTIRNYTDRVTWSCRLVALWSLNNFHDKPINIFIDAFDWLKLLNIQQGVLTGSGMLRHYTERIKGKSQSICCWTIWGRNRKGSRLQKLVALRTPLIVHPAVGVD